MESGKKSCKKHRCACRDKISGLIRVTNLSRLPLTLINQRYPTPPEDQPFIWFRNTEDECDIAVDPTNPDNLIVGTHQDRFDNFLADIFNYSLNGGKIWNEGNLVLSRSQGATNIDALDDFESASDPHVEYDPRGNAYACSVSFNVQNNFNEAIIVAKSTDKGRSWNRITAVTMDDGNEHFLDFQQIAADPYRKFTLYVNYTDDLAVIGIGENTSLFFKSKDEGATWIGPIFVASYPALAPAYGPLNTRVLVFPTTHNLVYINYISDQTTSLVSDIPGQVVALRSIDEGNTWQQFTITTGIPLVTPIDPETGRFIAFPSVASIALNRCNGKLYATWPDPRFNPTGRSGVVVSLSSDEGQTWTPPIPANPTTLSVQTFGPAVAVLDNGLVGVFFYDFRFFQPGGPLWTDAWLAIFDSKLQYRLQEIRLTETSFDTRQAIIRQPLSNAWFLADYIGLKSFGDTFYVSFPITNPPYGVPPVQIPVTEFRIDTREGEVFPNRQDIVFRKLSICKNSPNNCPLSVFNIRPTIDGPKVKVDKPVGEVVRITTDKAEIIRNKRG